MKITDVKCAILGDNPVVRVVTDEGISGYGEVESYKPYLKSHVLHYRQFILDEDPTDVERVMLKIRHRGAFKPWGSAVSAIEMALWDVAGKAAGVPVYKLLGGKIRDRVRVYNGAVRFPLQGYSPADYAENMAADEGGQRRLHPDQAGHWLPQPDGARGARLPLWRSPERRPPARQP